ncbi:MAG TPA: glycosyltransferase family 39 protein [Candidatus Binatia bacterium]|nr:glycosyltransferase family 39 protein [Candidatus Binatia bacterium]
MRWQDLAGPISVLGAWCVAVLLIGPAGEFPLSDDWAYAHVVRSLCHENQLDLLPWTGASLVFQAGYGALACRIVGFSYEVLRATTLVLGGGGILLFWCLLGQLGISRSAATASAALLGFCPVYLNLSFTFMTDVPFAVATLAAACLYVRGLQRPSTASLFWAGAMTAAALLIRQHGIFLAAAASLACFADRGHPFRERLLRSAAAMAAPAFTMVAYLAWVAMGDVPSAVHNKVHEATTTPILEIGNAAFRSVATIGLFLSPLAAGLLPQRRHQRRIAMCAAAVLGALAAFLYVREGDLMFYLPNVVYDLGVGSVTLRDAFFLALERLPRAGLPLQIPLTLVSLASAAVLVARWFDAAPLLSRPDAIFIWLAAMLLWLGSLIQSAYYFDRYLVPIVPLAIAAAALTGHSLRPRAVTWTMTGALALFSVSGTHDWMEWNRARWSLLHRLEERGATAEQIDGGFEYNAERLAARLGTAPSDAQARPGQAASVKSWWWVVDDRWIIAFGPLDGYRAVDERSFTRWLPPGTGRVFTLECEPAPSPTQN